MERKLLITVGDDLNCLYGVHFVCSFFRNKEDMQLTLLHVAPKFEAMDAHESERLHEIDAMLREIYRKKGQRALEASREILLDEGFSSERVVTNLIYKHHGMTKDIVDEARQGSYQAIVLGRRGYSIFEKFFHPRPSDNIIGIEDFDLPLWVCRRPVRGLRNVLLCCDGSKASLRIAGHVGWMIADQEEHTITLLHVADENRPNVEEILGETRQKLIDNGVQGDRIGDRVVSTPLVSEAIRQEAISGAYAVVALGRQGIKLEGAADKRLMGSKSLELLETLDRSAVWVGM